MPDIQRKEKKDVMKISGQEYQPENGFPQQKLARTLESSGTLNCSFHIFVILHNYHVRRLVPEIFS
jgi:hypothetical protein